MIVERIWILLLFPAALILIYSFRKKSFFIFPSLDIIPDAWGGRAVSFIFQVVPVLLLLLLTLLAAGLRFPMKEAERYGYGADIVFLLDESGSMTESFRKSGGTGGSSSPPEISKFSAAKSVITRFMEKRKSGRDRYGLTVFGSTAIPTASIARTVRRAASAALRIAPNSLVVVQSRRGRMTARAFVTHTVQPKQVFVPMHFARTNELTFAAFDQRSRQPAYKACAVSVRAVADGEE